MRRSTAVFLLLFLVMASAYYYFKNRAQPPDSADIAVTLEPQAETRYLFNSEDGVLNRIRIEAATGEVIDLAQDENVWVVEQPFEAAAEQGAAGAAASQVTTIRI